MPSTEYAPEPPTDAEAQAQPLAASIGEMPEAPHGAPAGAADVPVIERLLTASSAGDLVGFTRLLVQPEPHGLDETALRVLLAETLLHQDPTAERHVRVVEDMLGALPPPRPFIDRWPANASLRARMVLGYMYRGLGRSAEALEAFRQAFGWRPDIAECADCLAYQLEMMGDAAGAARVREEHAGLAAQTIDQLPPWTPPAAAVDPRGRYLDLLERSLCNMIYGDASHSSYGDTRYDVARRLTGRDLPTEAHSMIGLTRLRHLRWAAETVLSEGVPGNFIEAGVWRGGACILMAGVLAAHGDVHRQVFVADSFAGLPPPDPRYAQDLATQHDFHLRPELAVGTAQVAANFRRYDLLNENIRFVEGWFVDTLPPLKNEIFAILRLDGDLYSSTMDTLVPLYDSVAPGGFVICDDFGIVLDARRAIIDFRKERGITNHMFAIDGDGIYWRK